MCIVTIVLLFHFEKLASAGHVIVSVRTKSVVIEEAYINMFISLSTLSDYFFFSYTLLPPSLFPFFFLIPFATLLAPIMVSSCQRLVQFLVYTASSAAFFKTFSFMIYEFPTPINQTYGSHAQYLTILGLGLAHFAQIIGIFATILNCSKLRCVKQSLDIVVAPMEALISILYWSIKAVDPGLLIDPRIAVVPPMWLDICMHFLPTVVELFDVILFNPQWNMSFLTSLVMFSPVGYFYWWWTHFTYEQNGFFPYPLLGLVDDFQRVQIFIGSVVIVSITQQVIKQVQKLRGSPAKEKTN